MTDAWAQFADAPADPWGSFADASPEPEKSKPNTLVDAAKSFVSGIGKGGVGLLMQAAPAANPLGTIQNVLSSVTAGAVPSDPMAPGGDIISAKDWATSLALPKDQRAKFLADAAARRQALGLGTTGETINAIPGVNYQPQTTVGQYAGAVGEFIPAVATPGAEESFLIKGARALAGGVGSEGAADLTKALGGGETAQNAARSVGGFLGALSPEGTSIAAKGASKVAGPIAAAVSPAAAERQAGAVLAGRATNLEAAQAALVAPGEIVPGSEPTTFQQTGDLGLGALERETAAKNPVPFRERSSAQNEARLNTLSELEPGGDPNDVAKALKARFEDLDKQTQADVDRAVSGAQEKAAAVGGTEAPEAQGQAIRAAVNDAEDAARQREGALWKAVDPDGNLTGNVTQTAKAAEDIAGEVSATAKPMEGEEAAIFKVASELPSLSPVSDLVDLRSRVSTALRAELIANGRSPTYARLSKLRGAIQDNLATTIAHQVALDGRAVANGVLAPEQATGARLQAEANEFKQRQTEARRAVGGGIVDFADGRPGAIRGVNGAEIQTAGGPGNLAGNPGLSAAPTFDEAAAGRLAEATEATKQRARTFGLQPISSITAKAGASDLYRLPEGSVPAKVFRAGPSGYTDTQAFLKAVGEERGLPLLEDYAATTLRRAALREDGTIDPAKFRRWKKGFANALRAFPSETRARFADAAKAGQAVEEATAGRASALKDAQAGALGRVLGLSTAEDVTATVGQILNSRTAGADMLALAKATAKDPAARQGLRRAVADYISKKLISNTEAAASGKSLIKSDAYQTFIKTARPALNVIFKPEEVRSLEAISDDLKRANRSVNAVKLPGGSNTTQDFLGATKGKLGGPTGRTILDAVGAYLGSHLGPLGAVGGVMASEGIQALRTAGITRVDQLVTEAMLHPEVAREMLKKLPQQKHPLAWRGFSRALTAAQIGGMADRSQQPSKGPTQ